MWKRKRHGLSLTTITCFTLAENWKCGWSRHISSSVQVHWLLIQGRNSIQQPVAISGNEAFHRMTGNSMETFKCHQILLVHVGVLSSLSFSTHPPTCMCADIHIYIAMDTLLFLSEISGIPLCPSPNTSMCTFWEQWRQPQKLYRWHKFLKKLTHTNPMSQPLCS